MTSLAPSRALALLTLVLLQGCYFFYPTTLPKLPGPTIVDGGRMEVSVRETTAYTMCFKSDLQAGRCVWHRNDWAMERTRYTARASYAGRELTQGEFYLLTRDGYPAAVKKIQSRKGTCNISLVPSVIAFAGAMFATVVLASGDRIAKSDDDKLLLYGAGAGTFALGAIASYPLGGYACRRAGGEGDAIKVGRASERRWESFRRGDLDEVIDLANAFNARGGRPPGGDETPPPSREAPPTEAPPAETPPAEVMPAAGDSVLSALRGTGKHGQFVKLIEAAGMANELGSGAAFTVLAPTDAGLASAISEDAYATLLGNPESALRLVQHFFARDAFLGPGAKKLRMLDRKWVKIEVFADGYQVDRNRMTGAPIRVGSSVIYSLEAEKK